MVTAKIRNESDMGWVQKGWTWWDQSTPAGQAHDCEDVHSRTYRVGDEKWWLSTTIPPHHCAKYPTVGWYNLAGRNCVIPPCGNPGPCWNGPACGGACYDNGYFEYFKYYKWECI